MTRVGLNTKAVSVLLPCHSNVNCIALPGVIRNCSRICVHSLLFLVRRSEHHKRDATIVSPYNC
ncbi:hypothetical protein ARMGADRAFT_1018447 [Armillaria gallica]|uniref:Uncharacterized protein n=1 Tax=Armillaria gallica TaxID=47427 RepID=A0A2H3CNX3_ARMGA|nr:hypothetical protein ARMGADRAFT_1018447 [Armillaria gallica]